MEEKYIVKDKEYFIETQNGPFNIRNLQEEILTIMDEVHRICEKNNIKYCLIAGSALGIVNYGGFIPWDDDIDMAITREDWSRFIEALKQDLNDDFYFQCFEVDKSYNTIMGPNMKIRKKGTYIEEENVLLKNKCKNGDGIFLDVIIYDNMSENKFIDELNRTAIKIAMPFIIFLENINLNPKHLKAFVNWKAKRYSLKYQNSKLASQTISYIWEKIGHEPVFLKKDVYPFKLYNFEGRQFYSYNNIENVMHKWYGPNCLKKWNGKEYIETLAIEKRKPKHIKNIKLNNKTK